MLSSLSDIEALCEQEEVKAKAELSTIWWILKSCLNMHTVPLCQNWETYWFEAFKEIFIQWLADY